MPAKSNISKLLTDLNTFAKLSNRVPASNPIQLMWSATRPKTIRTMLLRPRRRIHIAYSIQEKPQPVQIRLAATFAPPVDQISESEA